MTDVIELPDENNELAKLSDNHRMFVEKYVLLRNATKAYMLVYPESTLNAAMANSSRLISRSDISAAIEEQRNIIAKECQLDRTYFISRLTKMIDDEKTPVETQRKAITDLAKITGHTEEKNVVEERYIIYTPPVLTPAEIAKISFSSTDVEDGKEGRD